MSEFYDNLETRSADARAADWAATLPAIVAHAAAQPGYASSFKDIDPSRITDTISLATFPVLRKSDLAKAQAADPPFGGFVALDADIAHKFQSPGNIFEPGSRTKDWFRLGRFLHAAGIGSNDTVQNCFSYHLTPAGMMFESAAAAVGATTIPAGTGQTEQQVQAAAHLGSTTYAGTPDYLKIILEAADKEGVNLESLTHAVVGGGALFPSLRQYYIDRGIACLQCYATADLGNIAYESPAMEGMIIDEGVIVEIVTPGTGIPVPDGEVGEVVVTSSNPDYPLIRFATGDLSAILPGQSPCGRTNARIKGWMGRADQTAKIKGMFVRPEQVAELRSRLPGCGRARLVITRKDEQDQLHLRIEDAKPDAAQAALRAVTKLGGTVETMAAGTLPADGIIIEDQRDYSV